VVQAITVKQSPHSGSQDNNKRSPYTIAPAAPDPLAGIVNPAETTSAATGSETETPEDEAVFQKVLNAQTRELLRETAAQDLTPGKKRALTLTPQEIQELKKSGRLIY